MTISAMKQALEALEWNYGTDLENIENCTAWLDKLNATIPALRQAIAEAVAAEPVAWFIQYEYRHEFLWREPTVYEKNSALEIKPLYTAPVHTSDIPQERVDETAKREHELAGTIPISNGGIATSTPTDFFAPPKREWVGLTDEERRSIREWQRIQEELGPVWAPMMLYLYLAIEAKLREKNS